MNRGQRTFLFFEYFDRTFGGVHPILCHHFELFDVIIILLLRLFVYPVISFVTIRNIDWSNKEDNTSMTEKYLFQVSALAFLLSKKQSSARFDNHGRTAVLR